MAYSYYWNSEKYKEKFTVLSFLVCYIMYSVPKLCLMKVIDEAKQTIGAWFWQGADSVGESLGKKKILKVSETLLFIFVIILLLVVHASNGIL